MLLDVGRGRGAVPLGRSDMGHHGLRSTGAALNAMRAQLLGHRMSEWRQISTETGPGTLKRFRARSRSRRKQPTARCHGVRVR
jgi:hypothetical protein